MKEVPADRRLKGCPKLVVVHPIQVHTRDTVALGDDISVALGSASRLLLAPVFLSGTYRRYDNPRISLAASLPVLLCTLIQADSYPCL